MQRKDGWVRITKIYDAACENGRSRYVDEGRDDCIPANGITDGKFAEWVPESALVKIRPADPADTATLDEKLIAQSDDFARYRKSFTTVAQKLIADGRCSAQDFEEMGGWVKSVNDYRNEPVYFTYCGGMTSANKIYMNAATGQVM